MSLLKFQNRMKRTTYCFLTLFVMMYLLSACSQKEEQGGGTAWDCRESNTTDTIDIQSFFDHASILCLEETEKSRIGQISKIVMADTLVFIADKRMSRQIFVFNNRSGRFLNTIGRVGHGPGEYIDITDIAVNPEERMVYVLCEKERVCKFDFDGKYLGQDRISFFADAMEYQDGKFYFACYRPGHGNVIVTDKELNETKSHLVNDPDEPVVITVVPLPKSPDGTVSFFRYLDNNIYAIDENDDLYVRYAVDLGDNTLTREEMKGVDKNDVFEIAKSRRCEINTFVENDKYACIYFLDHNVSQTSLLNKETGEVTTFTKENMKDSALGFCSYYLEYAFGDALACQIGNRRIREELIENKDCAYGQNPAIYFLHCGK